ncbi:hypothetical protein MNBD_CHLOROFLEXI01-394 [hydrothermal vent metagenome]|uniref:Uncharacterized protein n=1 Tax=hydrothermal vent metagenome TaxID=652676 RepID=A0A3B0UX49_9ZZZZ
MNKKAVLLWIIALLLLAACGGGSEPETPATNNDTSSSSTTESADDADEEVSVTETDEEMEEATDEPSDEAMEEEAMEEETADDAEDETVEEAAPASPFGNRPMTGTDPDTGLTVNPDSVNLGDTFIVRGEIISMNLTPTTSPEFLFLAPGGLKFRIRSQDLADTFFEDGDQLQAFQYQPGLLGQATATLAADASSSDIPTSEDLVLVKDE